MTARLCVIIPCYNGADTLPDTLRSLRRQAFRRWEAIVVDDGSTDDSIAVAEKWARADRRIRVLPVEHGGVARAWNHGLTAARSPWLAFLDCDDWLARDAYAHLLKLADRRPSAGVVMGGTRVVLPDGRTRPYPQPDLTAPFEQLCFRGGVAIHSAILQRRLAIAVGGFDPALTTHEDWDFWQRLARTGVEFAQTHKVVAFYRARPGSLSRRVWQFAVDGLEVMGRGHAPDPRVPDPDPAYAEGGPADELPLRRLYFALWSAARDIAAGGDGLAIAGLLAVVPQLEFEPRDMGELLASGMADMAACAPAELSSRWAEFEPKLRAVLERAVPRPEAARTRRLCLAVIKARLNGGSQADDDVIDLDHPRPPPATLGAGAPAVFQLRAHGRTVGAVALAALGPMSRDGFAARIAAQSARLPLKASLDSLAPWTAPPFWRAAVTALARPTGRARLRADFLRMRIRTAAATGLAAVVAARLKRAPAAAHEDAHARELAALKAEFGVGADAPPPAAPVRWLMARPSGKAHSLRVPVLTYHRIAADGPLPRFRVTPHAFAEQMHELQRAGFRTIAPEEFADALETGRPIAGRAILLTFDDGYDDFYEHAWPVLRACGFTATVFAVAGKLGGAADWDMGYGAPARLMSAERLRELSHAGITIGSHTFTHRWLTRLDVRELYHEALASAAAITELTGHAPIAFCYPYGAQDPLAEQVVEEAGYRLAMSTTPGVAHLASVAMRIPRIEVVGNDDLHAFRRKLRITDPAEL